MSHFLYDLVGLLFCTFQVICHQSKKINEMQVLSVVPLFEIQMTIMTMVRIQKFLFV